MDDLTNEVRQKGIQSVEQASALLEALITAGTEQSLTVLARAGDMSPSSAHRYLTSLVRTGLVQQNAANGKYDLGTMAVRLGLSALARLDFTEIAASALTGLTQKVGVDGHVCIWGDHGPTIIRVRQTHFPILTNLRLGRTLPTLLSASGLVFCAFTPAGITSPFVERERIAAKLTRRDVEARIADTRASGFGWIDGTVIPGLRAIAAPVFDPQGDLAAVLALVGQSEALVNFPNKMLSELLATTQQISADYGCTVAGLQD